MATYFLAFNNEPLNLTEHNNPAVQAYHKIMEQLGEFDKKQNPKLSYPIEMEFTSDYYSPAHPYDPEIPETYCQQMTIPSSLSATFKTERGLVGGRWTVYENMNIDDKGNKKYSPNSIKIEHRMRFNKSDATDPLLFFLLFVSPFCEIIKNQNGEALLEHQNTSNKAKKYLIRNKQQEIKEEANKKKLLAKLNTMLWDEEHGLGDAKIMQLGEIYNIPNANDERRIDEIKIMLEKTINKDNIDSMVKFMSEVNKESDLDIKQYITYANNFDIIKPEKKQTNTYIWCVPKEGDQWNICNLKKGKEVNECIFETFTENYDKFRRFKEAVDVYLKAEE